MINKFGSQANNPDVERSHGKESTKTTAGDTITGATSEDVNRGFGHPGVGETKTEIRKEGEHGRKRPSNGLEALGTYRQDKVERKLADQRGIDREGAIGGQHGDKGVLGAENIVPESAERSDARNQPAPKPNTNNRS